MKVSDLIELLKEQPQDMLVLTQSPDYSLEPVSEPTIIKVFAVEYWGENSHVKWCRYMGDCPGVFDAVVI